MKANTTLADELRTAVKAMPAKITKAKTCSIVKINGRTAGYIVFGARNVRVDVVENGKLVRYSVKTPKDIKGAVAALKRRSTKLAAKTNATKSAKRAKAPAKVLVGSIDS